VSDGIKETIITETEELDDPVVSALSVRSRKLSNVRKDQSSDE
jgi:hypothetical protein